MAKKKPQVVHIVQKAAWVDAADSYVCCSCDVGGYEGWPVRAFSDLEAATAFRLAREFQERKESNPFDYGEDLMWLSWMGDETSTVLLGTLYEMGLQAPENYDDIDELRSWWPPEGLTEEQAARLWDMFNQVRFFEVFSTELEDLPPTRGKRSRQGKDSAGALFVVQKVNWVSDSSKSESDPDWNCPSACSESANYPGRPLRAFTERSQAEAFRTAHEAAIRVQRNPFACGTYFDDVSSAEEPLFYDYLLDLGLDLPATPVDMKDWRAWWKKTAPKMTRKQLASIWEQMDRVRFFEVVETPWQQ
jgi:hypothetical protein